MLVARILGCHRCLQLIPSVMWSRKFLCYWCARGRLCSRKVRCTPGIGEVTFGVLYRTLILRRPRHSSRVGCMIRTRKRPLLRMSKICVFAVHSPDSRTVANVEYSTRNGYNPCRSKSTMPSAVLQTQISLSCRPVRLIIRIAALSNDMSEQAFL